MEEKNEFVVLEPVERKDRWYLWEIEDRVAQRVSPVFCAPSMEAIEREFQKVVAKMEAKQGDFIKCVIAVYDAGKLLTMEE